MVLHPTHEYFKLKVLNTGNSIYYSINIKLIFEEKKMLHGNAKYRKEGIDPMDKIRGKEKLK